MTYFKADSEKRPYGLTPRAIRPFYECKVPIKAKLRENIKWLNGVLAEGTKTYKYRLWERL